MSLGEVPAEVERLSVRSVSPYCIINMVELTFLPIEAFCKRDKGNRDVEIKHRCKFVAVLGGKRL